MSQKEIIKTPHAPQAIGPYSQAVKINGMVFISGQIPIVPETSEVLEEIESATHQVMKNLKQILVVSGGDFNKVVKTTIFLKDMDDFAKVNEIYASYFADDHFPARETVAVKTLPKNVLVEISMIAVL